MLHRLRIYVKINGEVRRRSLAFYDDQLELVDQTVVAIGELAHDIVRSLKWLFSVSEQPAHFEFDVELGDGRYLVGCVLTPPVVYEGDLWSDLDLQGFVEFRCAEIRRQDE